MRNIGCIAVRAIVCAICWSVSALLGPMVKAQEFPLIIDSSKLRQAGIAFGFGNVEKPLKNKCYHYGMGGHTISTSDEFYGRFKQRGFLVEAMCLGLVSNTHYDPETGRRLPTYMVVFREQFNENMRRYGKVVDLGVVSDELPLDLPDCFKNANPYTDCRFRFGRITGKTLMAAQTDAYKRLGAAIDNATEAKIRDIPPTEEFYGQEGPEGFRRMTGYILPLSETNGAIPEDLKQYSSATFWIRSTSFLRGYGYALDAEGDAGPDINPAALKAASKSQIDVKRLREILYSPTR
jgi:hypothetical protein